MKYLRATDFAILCGLILSISGCGGSGSNNNDNNTSNNPPTANATLTTAGPLMAGATITVSGAGSTDPQSQPLTYAWTLLAKPANSAAAISPDGSNPATARFLADANGIYTVRLVVTDSVSLSATTDLDITVDKARWGAATWGSNTFSAP